MQILRQMKEAIKSYCFSILQSFFHFKDKGEFLQSKKFWEFYMVKAKSSFIYLLSCWLRYFCPFCNHIRSGVFGVPWSCNEGRWGGCNMWIPPPVNNAIHIVPLFRKLCVLVLVRKCTLCCILILTEIIFFTEILYANVTFCSISTNQYITW